MAEEKKVFAKGLCFEKLFLIFVIGSIFGALYEELLTFIKIYVRTGEMTWLYRRGVIYGPFSPVYGMGAVIFVSILGTKKRKWYQTLLYGCLLGGGFEFLISLLQEIFIGTTSWNYSHQFLNIQGRTTVPIMFFWGLLSLFLINFIYPRVSGAIERIPVNFGKRFTYILLIFLVLDMFISWTALFRQTLRRQGHEPYTKIGYIYDRVYTDEFLKKYFTNMVPKK